MYMEEDGWRNEDDEGPYCPILRTKGDWTILKYTGCPVIYLRKKGNEAELEFKTVEQAKAFVKDIDLEDETEMARRLA
jgi:hypothetical protein